MRSTRQRAWDHWRVQMRSQPCQVCQTSHTLKERAWCRTQGADWPHLIVTILCMLMFPFRCLDVSSGMIVWLSGWTKADQVPMTQTQCASVGLWIHVWATCLNSTAQFISARLLIARGSFYQAMTLQSNLKPTFLKLVVSGPAIMLPF